MNAPTFASMNGSSPFAHSWLEQSVQQFFSGINWENTPPVIHELAQELTASVLQGTAGSLSLDLTVSQFFAAIPWDGATIASLPAVPVVEASSQEEDANSLTLEGFFDLF